ncbi:hypothetical protein [Mycobacterium sp. C31M]
MSADWTVRPRKGLGKLLFGMSPAEVDALSDTYGAVTGRMSDAISEDILLDTLEKFGDALSEQEKQALIAAHAEVSPALAGSVTETRGEPGLILRYDDDRLIEIMPARGQRPLFIDGVDWFSLGAREALTLLERLNGAPGRYTGLEAAFDNLAVSVDGCSVTDATGVHPLGESDERFQERTVMLRAEPYLPDDGPT